LSTALNQFPATFDQFPATFASISCTHMKNSDGTSYVELDQPSVQRVIIFFTHVQCPGHESDQSRPPSADVSALAYISGPLYSFTWPGAGWSTWAN
jgi:hypothetical protein